MCIPGTVRFSRHLQSKSLFDKQLEQKDNREDQTDVTLIVNPFSLPLIFHVFSCLLCCFPAQSADRRHLLRLRPSHRDVNVRDLWLRPLARSISLFLDSCFFSNCQESAVNEGVCVCVSVSVPTFKDNDGVLHTMF